MRPENGKQQALFEAWFAADREMRKAAESCSVSERTGYAWAERFKWHARADSRDQEAAKRAEKQAIARRVQVLEEQRRCGELLRRRGTEHIVKHAIESTADAIRAIEKGIALERSAEEFAAARLEVTGKDGGPIVVGDVGLARAELAEKLTRFVDALTAGSIHRDALTEDGDDPAV